MPRSLLVGTLYPLAIEALTADKISVGAPFFNATFGPVMIPLLIAVPCGALLAWKRRDIVGVVRRLGAAFVIAVLGMAVTLALKGTKPLLAPFGVGLALYLIAGALTDLVERTGLFRVTFGTAFRRAGGMSRSFWGTACAHIGLGMTLLGITAETSWSVEKIVALKPGTVIAVRSYDFPFEGSSQRNGLNYRDLAAKFTIRRGSEVLGVLERAKRSFAARQ